MKKGTKIQVFLLCLVPFIMVLGNSMLIPVLPKIKKAVGINQFQVGLMVTAFSIPAGIVIPFAGILSDQVGRRKVMAPALIVYGVGGIIAGLASMILDNPYWGIMIGRIIQGIGAGGTYQLAMATAGDIFKTQERVLALGLLEASNGLGKVISPILGAGLALITWYFPFFAYGFLAIPIGLFILFLIKEQTEFKKQPFKHYIDAVKEIFKNKAAGLLTSFFAGMVALFTLFGISSLYSDILEKDYGIYGITKGLIMAGPVFIMASLSFGLGLLLEKSKNKGLKAFVITGLFFILSGQGLFLILKGMWLKFASLVLLGAGVGLVMTPVNTLVTGSCSSKRRGIITCLYGSLRFFGVAIGPPLYGLSEEFGLVPTISVMTLAPLLSLILSFIFIKIDNILPQEESQKANLAPAAESSLELERSLHSPSKKSLTFKKKLR
ncbi:MAG TPA: MFS transporter [Thermoanaerobacterales bacterium]|nr:MFS transporter [Thermoanaerobacterales bacterium]